jgi:methionyl-tRNA formyltransferase
VELSQLRFVFMGTPAFASPTLDRLVAAGHECVGVFTQPDRPKGRGQHLSVSPVKETALRLGLTVHQPERIRRPEQVELLASLKTDVMVVVGYGQIIPQSIIDLPRLGIVNVHASLLPKYRGAAPIQWAIANGETVTGVTTMSINAGLDTGAMLLKSETPIGPDETAEELSARLAEIGADLAVLTLEGLRDGKIRPEPQDDSEATWAPVLKREDGLIHWDSSAFEIHNRARGFRPWPGAYTTFRNQRLHIWLSKPHDISLGPPGSIRIEGRKLMTACGGNTALEIQELQLEGRKRVSAEAFVNGHRLGSDEMLGEKKN